MDVIGSIEAKVRSLASSLAVATGQNLDLVESLLSLDQKTQDGKLKRLEVALGIIVEKAQIWSRNVEMFSYAGETKQSIDSKQSIDAEGANERVIARAE